MTTRNNSGEGGNNVPAATGSTVNFQLASQLLSAISSGLSSGHQGEMSRTNAQMHYQPHHTMNPTAQAAGQLLLQHMGLQQPSNQHQSRPTNPVNYTGMVEDSVGGASLRKENTKSGHRSSEKEHHQKKSEDNAMPPSYYLVPCRARAMPAEHNSSSAVFEIPRDVKHGENLQCSFPQCRNEGVKFCYCLICGIPVAKRNFRQRHEHAGAVAAKDKRQVRQRSNGKSHATAVDASPPPRKRQHPQGRSHEDDPHRNPVGQRAAEQAHGQRNHKAPMENLVFQRRSGLQPETFVDSSNGDEMDRLRRWTALLRRRPLDTQGDEMSKWLFAVLEISDTSVESLDANNNGPSNDRQHDSSASNQTSNEGESSSTERSGESGSSGGTGWNSSSEGDSSGPSESSSGGDNNSRPQEGGGRMAQHHQYMPPHRQQQNFPIVSDFRNSTESPSGSNTDAGGVDAGGVDTTTNDQTSRAGSNDDTLNRETSSSMSGSMGSSAFGNAGQNKSTNEQGKRQAPSSSQQIHMEKKMKHG